MNYDYIQQTLFWSFVPATVTSMLQSLLYRIFPKRSAAKGTLAYRSHYNWIYTLIITGYLIFSVLQMDHDVKTNYYDVLNLPVGFKNKDLKVNYRALSLQYHPDKQETYVRTSLCVIWYLR